MNTLKKNAFPPCETQDFASLLLLAADVMFEVTLSADVDHRIFNEIRMKYIDLFGLKKVRDAASGAASRTYG